MNEPIESIIIDQIIDELFEEHQCSECERKTIPAPPNYSDEYL